MNENTFKAGMSEIRFNSRTKEWAWMSNFYLCFISYRGYVYPTAEHMYQACKSGDKEERRRIREAKTPSEARKIGKTVRVRKDWGKVRVKLMMAILKAKFADGSDMAEWLMSTKGAELIHEAPWDAFWGTGRDGDGMNILGRLLMGRRAELLKIRAKS